MTAWVLRQRPPGAGTLRGMVGDAPIVTGLIDEALRFETLDRARAAASRLLSDRVPLVPIRVDGLGPRRFRGQPD